MGIFVSCRFELTITMGRQLVFTENNDISSVLYSKNRSNLYSFRTERFLRDFFQKRWTCCEFKSFSLSGSYKWVQFIACRVWRQRGLDRVAYGGYEDWLGKIKYYEQSQDVKIRGGCRQQVGLLSHLRFNYM